MKSSALMFLALLINATLNEPALANETTLLQQLRGETCVFDSQCGTHWSWWRRQSIRRPEYRCRMQAVSCIMKMKLSSPRVKEALKDAMDDLPAQFNTGDGTIGYALCFERGLAVLEDPSSKAYLRMVGACAS